MKITGVDVYPLTVPLSSPVVMANQVIEHSENVLVRVTTDEDVVGWGEGVAAPVVTGDTQDDIVCGVKELADLLVGADPRRHRDLWQRIHHSNAAGTAVAALDIALVDLVGHIQGVPVVELLGGRQRDRIPVLRLIGSGHPEDDLATLRDLHSQGFRWFKLKVALSDPETEIAVLRDAAAVVGSDGVICADANEGWDPETALHVLGSLDGSGVRYLEQPVPRQNPEAMTELVGSSPVPICADESAATLDDLETLAGIGIGGVSLKLIKHGGITGVMRGAQMCEELGLEINLAGKVAETSVAATANLHCAAAMPSLGYGCSPAHLSVRNDVVENQAPVTDGCLAVPEGPGLGIEVDLDRVRAWSA